MKEDYKCPCKEVDPDNFLTNDQVEKLIATINSYKFTQEDYLKVYNCIHCNDCGTAEERFILKHKFLNDGNKIEGLDDVISTIEEYGTPFKLNKSRIKPISGVKKESKTLLYLGCFTKVKTPKYGENLVRYLLKNEVDFTILEEEVCCGYPILCTGETKTYDNLVRRNKALFVENGYEKIITACPSCYMVFKKEYQDLDIKIDYFTDYLKPTVKKKKGNLIIQHACPLRNGAIEGIVEKVEEIFKKSGYNVLESVPNECCGGGIGHQLRVEVINEIAQKRMEQFNVVNIKGLSENYITTYCPDAYWIIKVFGRKKKIKYELRDMCDLLV